MIMTFEVKTLLDKKWQFVCREMFKRAMMRHFVLVLTFTISTLLTPHYRDTFPDALHGQNILHLILEISIVLDMLHKFWREGDQVRKFGTQIIIIIICDSFSITTANRIMNMLMITPL
jgi:hypothetical protein